MGGVKLGNSPLRGKGVPHTPPSKSPLYYHPHNITSPSVSALPNAKDTLCRTLTRLKESPDSERRKPAQERWAILEAAAGVQGRAAPRKVESRLDGARREQPRYESEGMGRGEKGGSSLSATGRLSLAFLGTKVVEREEGEAGYL